MQLDHHLKIQISGGILLNPASLHGSSSLIALMASSRVGGLSSSTLVGSCGMQRTAKTWTVWFALKSVSKCLDQCLRGLDCEELLIIPCSPCSLHTAESSRPGAPTSHSGSPRPCLEGCCRLDESWLSSRDRTAMLGGPGGLTSSRLVVTNCISMSLSSNQSLFFFLV